MIDTKYKIQNTSYKNMISEDKVKHIAKLARIGLTPSEIEKFQKELSSILDYIKKLKEVDISKVEPTSHSIKIENVMREDKIKSQKHAPYRIEDFGARSKIKNQKLLELTPEIKNGYLKVKSIL